MFDRLKKEVNDVKRLEEIFSVLAKNEINLLKQRKRITPEALKNVLEELGGSFIKLGQLLSLRPDLIPLDYCKELTKLQDNVKPISFKTFESEFKKNFPLKKIIINKKPLGSASIAQVHIATYKGKKVVLKIRKPGVKEKFDTDLDILKKLAKLLTKKYKFKHINPLQIAEEFESYTRAELDLSFEASNLSRVNKLKHQPGIKIPTYYPELSNEAILCMQYIPGKKLSEIKNPSNKIFETLAKEFWDEIFDYGLFHADPHPGNLIISKNTIGIIDWGIVGELSNDMRNALRNMFFGVILKDTDAVVYAIQKLNLARVPLNSYDFKRDIQQDLDKYYGKNLDEIKASEVFERLLHLMREYDFYIDKNYILLMKAILTVESVGLTYKKDFNLFSVALPYVEKKTKKNLKEVAKQELLDLRKTLTYLKRLPEEASSFFQEELRQERLLYSVKDEITTLNEEIKTVSHEIILLVGAAAITITSVLILSYEINGFPYISAFGFVMAAAMILNLLHIIRK